MSHQHSSRLTVEQCFALSVADLRRAGLFERPLGTESQVNWSDTEGLEIFQADVWVTPSTGGRLLLRVRYEISDLETGRRGSGIRNIQIVETKCPFGGARRWLICPLVRQNGLFCRRRVVKLFLPQGAREWACATCHRLLHRSAKQHDTRVDHLASDPAAYVDALRSSSLTQLALATRAASLVRDRLRRRSGKFFQAALKWGHAITGVQVLDTGEANIAQGGALGLVTRCDAGS
jgi:hypothetical protein